MKTALKTFGAVAMAGLMVAGLSAGGAAPAKADTGDFVAGVIIGGVAGSLATRAHDNRHRSDRYQRSSGGSWRFRKHINWCYRQYSSYDEYDNTWVSRGGRVRTCRSPYWG